MKFRLQLFELEDQAWFPHVVRQGMMDVLRFMITALGIYKPVVPLLQKALAHTRQTHLVDLCSGAGGGIQQIWQELEKQAGHRITITLTDKYPNVEAYQFLAAQSNGALRFESQPIDATAVPDSIPGFRTVFSAFHHFKPETAIAILTDAVRLNQGIGVFEGAGKRWHELLLVWFGFPWLILLITPFTKPFTWSRLFFTYLVPLIPLGTVWDGTVSLLRLYTPEHLEKMVSKIHAPHYTWHIGRARHWSGTGVLYLVGYPSQTTAMNSSWSDAWRLLRIPFSLFLMPIFWFALSATPEVSLWKAVAVFLILHLLVYPASNGYNSYYDRDEGSIGGLKHPPKVIESLYWLVLVFDILAVVFSALLSWPFAAMVLLYLLVSKAYSYEGIRLKKYPILSTVVVIVFQGAFTFAMVQKGIGVADEVILSTNNLLLALVSSLFLCGSYPLTQIYQHEEDSRRGDETLSLKLGLWGTFLFAAISLLVATALLFYTYWRRDEDWHSLFFMMGTGPVLLVFSQWLLQVKRNPAAANYENTMRMNKVSSLSMSFSFELIFLWQLWNS